MKTIAILFVLIAGSNLYGQSVLDALRQPTTNADFELLNQANQASQNSANAAAKRASLLQKRADTLRSQVDKLEKEIEELRVEHVALKKAVIDCRDQFLGILGLLEKQDFTAVTAPLEKLKATYAKTLLPKLMTKEPAVEAEPTVEAPVVLNPATQPAEPPSPLPAERLPADPQPAEKPQPVKPQLAEPQPAAPQPPAAASSENLPER